VRNARSIFPLLAPEGDQLPGEMAGRLFAGEKSSQAGKDRILVMLEMAEEKERQQGYRPLAGRTEVAADPEQVFHSPDDGITGIESVPVQTHR
jgi:hypothetical protein